MYFEPHNSNYILTEAPVVCNTRCGCSQCLSYGAGKNDAIIALHTAPQLDGIAACNTSPQSDQPTLPPQPAPTSSQLPLILTLGSHCNTKIKVCSGAHVLALVRSHKCMRKLMLCLSRKEMDDNGLSAPVPPDCMCPSALK